MRRRRAATIGGALLAGAITLAPIAEVAQAEGQPAREETVRYIVMLRTAGRGDGAIDRLMMLHGFALGQRFRDGARGFTAELTPAQALTSGS